MDCIRFHAAHDFFFVRFVAAVEVLPDSGFKAFGRRVSHIDVSP
jgi:hypothetical protein